MTTPIAFHFILLAVGEVLKVNDTVTPQKIQNFIVRDDAFGGIRVPLDDCRLALQLLEESKFIEKIGYDEYERWIPKDTRIEKEEYIVPIPEYGDLMELDKFIQSCKDGLLIDYDGSGYYSDGESMWRNRPAFPLEIVADNIDWNFTHVVWFNK